MAKPNFSGDYQKYRGKKSRSFINPKIYDPTPKKKREINVSKYSVVGGAVVLLLAFLVIFLFTSSIFAVKNITVEGEASQETVKALNKLKGRNIFLIGGRKAEREIVKLQPGIKYLKIVRGLPSSVVVKLVERDPALVWRSQGKNYLVDKSGVVYREGGGNGLQVDDLKNLPVKLGARIVSASFISYVGNLSEVFKKETGYEIESISVPETTFQIDVKTKGGPLIKLNTTRTIGEQLNDIKFITQNYGEEAKNLIDVRVEGYGYIK